MASDFDKAVTVVITLLLGYLGTTTTVLGRDWSITLKFVILVAGGILSAIAIAIEVRQYWSNRPIYRGTREGSHGTTARLMKQDGKTVVFTVSLSFTDNTIAHDALITEARKNSIILMLPRAVEAAQEILKHGGDVRFYGEQLSDSEWEPQTRFTITQFGEPGSVLYIGRDLPNGQFIIERYRHGTAAHAIAGDLVNYVRRMFPKSAIQGQTKSL